ncbi:hypothetical protein ACQKM2_35790 [Streptomyces sp. NPDC004126]|uniref:hypothetical protein n=1 Tax=Streptomyces sp. NPDC004126 TaxID=3390695 RepID=UPI003D003D56
MPARTSRRPRRTLRKTLLAGLACFAVLVPLAPASAADQPSDRFAEFLKAQGTFCVPDGEGGCAYFLPGIPNMLGWSNQDASSCALVDYAGLAAGAIRQQSGGRIGLDTSVTGTVTEKARTDGGADVRVRLHARKALTYVTQGCELADGPLSFGRSVPEVLAGRPATTSEARLDLTFINNFPPGGQLPDLVQLLVDPHLDQVPLRMTFHATARGPLRAASGLPEGTPGTTVIHSDVTFAEPENRRDEIRLEPRRHTPAD